MLTSLADMACGVYESSAGVMRVEVGMGWMRRLWTGVKNGRGERRRGEAVARFCARYSWVACPSPSHLARGSPVPSSQTPPAAGPRGGWAISVDEARRREEGHR